MADDLKRLNIITHTDDTIRHKLNKNLKILYKIIDLNNYIIILYYHYSFLFLYRQISVYNVFILLSANLKRNKYDKYIDRIKLLYCVEHNTRNVRS